jgi:hypothetical protein
LTQRIGNDDERRSRLTSAGIVKMKARKRRAPVRQHPQKLPAFDLRQNPLFGNEGKTGASECGSHGHRRRIVDKLSFDTHVQFAASFFELPRVNATGRWQPNVDAVMCHQVLRRFWF